MRAQGWPATRQRALLQSLPASVAGEATFQLLLQASAGWAVTEDDEDEQGSPLQGAALAARQATAQQELELATATVLGLPFEEKARLVTELEPKAAAALVGAQPKNPWNPLPSRK